MKRGALRLRRLQRLQVGRIQSLDKASDPRSKVGRVGIAGVELANGLEVVVLLPCIVAHGEEAAVELADELVAVAGTGHLHHADLDDEGHELAHVVDLLSELLGRHGVLQ